MRSRQRLRNLFFNILCQQSYSFLKYNDSKFKNDYGIGVETEYRFATEEEKQKLFEAIEANGYKWNSETKILEKLIEPKFKVGDKIKHKSQRCNICTVKDIQNNQYIFEEIWSTLSFNEQHHYELVLDKVEPKFKVGDRIKSTISSSLYTVVDIKDETYYIKNDGEKYPYPISFSQENLYELVADKFDISILKPFESKVLVRDSINSIREYDEEHTDVWRPAIWGVYVKDNLYPFGVQGGCYFNYCIPYEGNEHLLGTTDDCDEFYKNW